MKIFQYNISNCPEDIPWLMQCSSLQQKVCGSALQYGRDIRLENQPEPPVLVCMCPTKYQNYSNILTMVICCLSIAMLTLICNVCPIWTLLFLWQLCQILTELTRQIHTANSALSVAICGVTLSTRHSRVAIYAGTLCANMTSWILNTPTVA